MKSDIVVYIIIIYCYILNVIHILLYDLMMILYIYYHSYIYYSMMKMMIHMMI